MKLLVITTGGTIGQEKTVNNISVSGKKDHSIDFFKSDLIPKGMDITINSVCNIDSSYIQPSHWKKIVTFLMENHDKYDGFIITHGTNTLDYTCAALCFMLEKFNKPVVVTRGSVTITCFTVMMHK